jgi:hypothetical protein
VFFTRALNNRLKDQSIIVNSVNPGFCYSELLRDVKNVALPIFQWLLAHSAEEGSRQLVWAAVGIPQEKDQTLKDLRGAYIHQSHIDEPSDYVLGEEGKKRENKLWVSQRHLLCISRGVRTIKLSRLHQNDLISVLEGIDPRIKDVVAEHLA